MAYSAVPLSFGNIGADEIVGVPYLGMKLLDGTEGSTRVVPARSSAPALDDAGLVVRPIPGSSTTPWYVHQVNASTGGSGAGSTVVDVNNPTTSVDAALSSAGSTREVGKVNQGTPGSSASPWWVRETNPSTGGGGAGSTAVDLASGGSTKIIGLVDGIPMTAARTSRNSSAEGILLDANAARRAAMIQNLATAVELLVSLSTAAPSSAGANVNFKVPANGFVVIGGQLGNIPLYTGQIRGKMNSTAIVGLVQVTEFT